MTTESRSPQPDKLLRAKPTDDRLGIKSPQTRRDHIERGLLTEPLKLSDGPSSPNLWPEREIDAIVAARSAGVSEPELREFVAQLMRDRARRRDALSRALRRGEPMATEATP